MQPLLSVERCRKVIGPQSTELSDGQVIGLRDMLYTLSDVIGDAYRALAEIDQSTLEPAGDAVSFFQQKEETLAK